MKNFPIFKTGLAAVILLFSTHVEAKWREKSATTEGGACQSFAIGDKLYIVGGYMGFTMGYKEDAQCLDPIRDKWSFVSSPSNANRSGGVGFAINGKGYVGLGQKNFLKLTPTPEDLLDMQEYDPETDTWKEMANFPGKARLHSAVFVLNKIAYLVGGELTETKVPTNEVWSFNPAANKWTQLENLPINMAHSSGFTLGSEGYVVGGLNDENQALATCFAYNADSNKWTLQDSLPQAYTAGTAFVLHGTAYFGLGSDKDLGESEATFSKTFYEFNLDTKTWTKSNTTWKRDGRLWPIAQVVNDKAYIGTGYKFDQGEYSYGDILELSFDIVGKEEMVSESMKLYPNPATNLLNIKLKQNAQMSLFSLSGTEVLNQQLNQGTNQVSMHAIETGIYLVTIINSEGILHQEKLIIQ